MYSQSSFNQLGGLGVVPAIPVAATGLIPKVTDFISNIVSQDNMFIRNRDGVIDVFKQNGWVNLPNYKTLFEKHKIAHKDIPDRKVGQNYGPEFLRLHEFVRDLVNSQYPGVGDYFINYSYKLGSELKASGQDDGGNWKGSVVPALKFVLANHKAIQQSQSIPSASVPTGGSNILNTASNLITQGADIYSQVAQQPAGQQPGTTYNASFGPAGQTDMKNLLLPVLIGGAAIGGYLLYQNSQKKKKSLGDLDTARTKAGKKRQRAAVFARMEDAGEIWPKRNGERKKPRKKKKRG